MPHDLCQLIVCTTRDGFLHKRSVLMSLSPGDMLKRRLQCIYESTKVGRQRIRHAVDACSTAVHKDQLVGLLLHCIGFGGLLLLPIHLQTLLTITVHCLIITAHLARSSPLIMA